MDWKKGMVVITQGNKHSWVSRMIKFASKSWYTHGFVVTGDNEAVEAKFPHVTKLNIDERIRELEQDGRDYIVLDYPGITSEEREQVAQQALTYVGRLYDIWNAVLYLFIQVWWQGTHRLVCSGLMAKSFMDGIHKPFFNMNTIPSSYNKYRRENLEKGFCTPDEVLRNSILTEIYRTHLSQ
jgi:hypothetical protein